MAIRKGEDWGEPGSLDPGAPTVSGNAELHGLINSTGFLSADPHGGDAPMVGLLGGDLARTLGSPGRAERLTSGEAHRLAVDLGEIRLDDGPPLLFAAHAVIRDRFYRGRLVAIMNAAWIDTWNIAPRSHPGDGRMELVDATLGWGDKLKARRRLPHGGHLPHSGIQVRRISSETVTLDRPTPILLDGEPAGSARQITVAVLPEALRVVV